MEYKKQMKENQNALIIEMMNDAEELGFQDISADPIGYKYLIETDENQNGLWTIYEVIDGPDLQLSRVQSYDTKRFWTTEDWYAADFNEFEKIDIVVESFSELTAITDAELNTIAKVTANSNGKWEIYRATSDGWDRVALNDGTIELSSKLWVNEDGRYGFDADVFDSLGFAEEPVIELRNIIRSINEELLISDLATDRNKAFMSVFNYILSEQPHVDWLYKTSLIDVNHKVRSLSQYAVYQKDNQDYLIDYIKEAKPYHTKIRDFLLSYDGSDLMAGSVTDFDCPSAYNSDFLQFISPVLDDGAILVTDPSNLLPDDPQWKESPWDQWIANYRLSIESVIVTIPGSGYTVAPTIEVTGMSLIPAEMTAVIVNGKVTDIIIDNYGSGYTETPVITFVGGNGTGATAVAVTDSNLVRSIKTTINYDRYQYQTKVVDWAINDNSISKNLVLYNELVYRVIELNTDASFVDSKYAQLLDSTGKPLSADSTLTVDLDTITVDTSTQPLSDVEKIYIKEGLPLWSENDNNISKNYVRFNDKVYLVTEFNTDTDFNIDKYTEIEVSTLSGIDRTSGLYVSDVNNPGLDLALLINGIAYPGVEVSDPVFGSTEVLDATYESVFPGPDPAIITAGSFEIGANYQIDTVGTTDFTLIGALDNLVGTSFRATGIGSGTGTAIATDTEYSLTNYSETLESYSGTRAIDIDVEGGLFIDTYHSHAPDELVPGSIFDTLDIKVFSRPGGDYARDGHAFAIDSKVYLVSGTSDALNFMGLSSHPTELVVVNMTTGATLYEGIDYTIDWPNSAVSITAGISASDQVVVHVYEIGGGLQLYREIITGAELDTNTTIIPVRLIEIFESIIFINGTKTTNFTTTAIDAQTSLITLLDATVGTDVINITVFGIETPTQYGASYPVTQTFTATPYDVTPGELTTRNLYNVIVEHNGLRLRPPEAARHVGDGVETSFLFPATSEIIQDLIANNKVNVYVNETLLVQIVDYVVGAPIGLVDTAGDFVTGEAYTITTLGTTDFTLVGAAIPPAPAPIVGDAFIATGPGTGTGTATLSTALNRPRSVILTVPPADGDTVDVFVSTLAAYSFVGDELILNTPVGSDIIATTTFKDTSQLGILTQVFVGPTAVSEVQIALFDAEGFDTEGGFDAEIGVDVLINQFVIDAPLITDPNRLWVTLNGERLLATVDYIITNDRILKLLLPTIDAADVLVVTSITESVVLAGVNFRLFKDMRDTIGMYALNDAATTELLQPITGDIIYVEDASVLGQPDLAIAKFGILTINGERITYRERDLVANTVSGLRRGTAGTAIVDHAVDDIVYDMSAKSLVPWDYDQIWYEPGTQLGDEDAIPLSEQTTIPALFIKD